MKIHDNFNIIKYSLSNLASYYAGSIKGKGWKDEGNVYLSK